MNKQKLINNIPLALIIMFLFFLPSSSLYAGEAISVTGGTWDIKVQEQGAIHAGEQVSSPANKWTVTGSEDGSEDIYIRVECLPGCEEWNAWDGSGSPAQEEFTLRENNASGYLIKSIDDIAPWITLPKSEEYQFGLWFEAPPIGSASRENTLTVTLTAKNWCEAGCDIYEYCSTGTCDGPGGVCGELSTDPACGTIDCSGWYVQTGTEGSTTTEDCYNKDDITTNNCEGLNNCKDPNTSDCNAQGNNEVMYSCAECKYISATDCTGTTKGSCTNYSNITDCGLCIRCDGSGSCNSYYLEGSKDILLPELCQTTHYRCDGSGNCTAPTTHGWVSLGFSGCNYSGSCQAWCTSNGFFGCSNACVAPNAQTGGSMIACTGIAKRFEEGYFIPVSYYYYEDESSGVRFASVPLEFIYIVDNCGESVHGIDLCMCESRSCCCIDYVYD